MEQSRFPQHLQPPVSSKSAFQPYGTNTAQTLPTYDPNSSKNYQHYYNQYNPSLQQQPTPGYPPQQPFYNGSQQYHQAFPSSGAPAQSSSYSNSIPPGSMQTQQPAFHGNSSKPYLQYTPPSQGVNYSSQQQQQQWNYQPQYQMNNQNILSHPQSQYSFNNQPAQNNFNASEPSSQSGQMREVDTSASCGNASHNINSESSLSSSPEHSASESSPAGSGAEGGESESADSDTISGTTARSEHVNQQLTPSNTTQPKSFVPIDSANTPIPKSASSGVLGRRPNAMPGSSIHSYPTPAWQQTRSSQFPSTNQSNTSPYQVPPPPASHLNQGPPATHFSSPPQAPNYMSNVSGQFSNLSLSNSFSGGVNSFAAPQSQTPQPVNLLSNRHVLPSKPVQPVKPKVPEHFEGLNCDPEIMRCTLNAIPQKQEDIAKAKLPFGLLIHPFKDLHNLPVIQSTVIVRCKSCRTYINPFVSFIDQRRWKCNMCYRTNDIPSDFMMTQNGRTDDVTKRPEICNSTVEFIAPGDYMLRPPQAALYLFLLDVSAQAVATGYLDIFCTVLKDNLNSLPGDARTKVSIICYDSCIHFLAVLEDEDKAQLLTFPDIEDMEIPRHGDLLINLHENKEKVVHLLTKLPGIFKKNVQTKSALGSALNAGQKLLSSIGGRITVFQSILPSVGPGKLTSREDPNERAATDVKNLKPATDFYKSFALSCSGYQIAVDLFAINSQYIDMATLTGMSKFCGGCIQAFPNLTPNSQESERFENDLQRYLTRKLGFEAVLRVRCTRGLAVSDFFGNFFVRSTDLLAFPNVNPDAGVSMRVKIEETLVSASNVCFQAALLYTTCKGERRIRVHTLYLPIANGVQDIVASADVQAVSCFLAQMAVDRSLNASISDARDALVNAVSDCLASYRTSLPGHASMGTVLIAPPSLALFPLYISALLKSKAVRVGSSTKLDERVSAMMEVMAMPIFHIMHLMYPPLYPVHNIHQQPLMGSETSGEPALNLSEERVFSYGDGKIPQPPQLQLSAESLAREGAYLLDKGNQLMLLVGSHVSMNWCMKVLNVANSAAIPAGGLHSLPEIDNSVSSALRAFITHLLESRPNHAPLLIIRGDDSLKSQFFESFVDDRTESSSSYVEFLQHINNIIIKSKSK